MTGIPVVLDVDTGVDDSLALLLAACSPALNLLGGDVPVAIGRDQPLLEKVVSAAYVHGEDGLGGLNASLPVPARTPEPAHAVDFLLTRTGTTVYTGEAEAC